MDMSPSIRDRIFRAAEDLYEQAHRQAFPTVDAVRKLAKVNMNDASTGMRAWRRQQTTQVAPMPVQVPPALLQASQTALGSLWNEAVGLANETLRAAQSGWDAERAESEALSEQMANAFELQATELEAAHIEIRRLTDNAERIAIAETDMQRRLERAIAESADATATARQAEGKAVEIERRADELRRELDHAHALAAESAKDVMQMRKTHSDEIAAIRSEQAIAREKADRDLATAQAALSRANETAATLRGKLAALGKLPTPATVPSKAKTKANGKTK